MVLSSRASTKTYTKQGWGRGCYFYPSANLTINGSTLCLPEVLRNSPFLCDLPSIQWVVNTLPSGQGDSHPTFPAILIYKKGIYLGGQQKEEERMREHAQYTGRRATQPPGE